MSAIEKTLVDLDIKPKRNEDRQDFLRRAAKEVAALPDKDWDALSDEAQDWANSVVDAINAKAKVLPDFPDLVVEQPETETRSRRSAPKDDADDKKGTPGTKAIDPSKVKVKMAVKVVTKRGKELSGTVIEIDKEVLVLRQGNGDEEELNIDRIETIYTLDTGADDDAEADPIKVGAEVVVTTKRGKELSGKIVELDGELLVLATADGEEELMRDRVESIKVKGGRAAAEPETKSRRSAPKDEGGEATDKKRSSNPAGVSVGQRIKELIAEDPSASIDDIDKALTKEGLEYKETSLKMNYADCHKFLECLKAAKRLK